MQQAFRFCSQINCIRRTKFLPYLQSLMLDCRTTSILCAWKIAFRYSELYSKLTFMSLSESSQTSKQYLSLLLRFKFKALDNILICSEILNPSVDRAVIVINHHFELCCRELTNKILAMTKNVRLPSVTLYKTIYVKHL